MNNEKTLRDVFGELSEEAWRSDEIQAIYEILRKYQLLDEPGSELTRHVEEDGLAWQGGQHIVEFENLLKGGK